VAVADGGLRGDHPGRARLEIDAREGRRLGQGEAALAHEPATTNEGVEQLAAHHARRDDGRVASVV